MYDKRLRKLLAYLTMCLSCAAFAAERISEGGKSEFPPGAEWPSYNKTLDGQRYSTLKQINKSNAAQLTEVCRVKIADGGSFQAGLIVIDDVMYATTSTDTMALDPTTCKIIWRHHHRRQADALLPVNRGVAYYAGRLFRGTDDGQVIALDASTGTELWSNVVGNPVLGESVTGSPVAWSGLVFVGTAVSEFGVRGRVMAYEAMTGREVWRFNTVPEPGEPNSDSWRNTIWNDVGGGGGGTWSHFALDPTTSEIFIPVGNPIPDFVPAERLGDNLYTNSVLVLDASTGALKWWYQLAPSDGLDHDLAASPVLYRNSKGAQMVAAGGKDGYVHIIDRRTHKLVAKTAVTTVDEPAPVPTPEGVEACPGPAGGVEWNGPAFDPGQNRLFVGSLDYCALFMSDPGTTPEVGGYNMGGTWTGLGTPRGWLYALDADTGAVAWRYHADHPVLGAVTPTAGGIVLSGDNAGGFRVFDSATGEILKEVDTGGSLSGGIITYQQRDRQYIAMTSGNISRSLFGAAGRPSIVIMALPQALVTAANSDTSPNVERGQAGFNQSCAVCHGGEGDQWNKIDLKAVKQKMTVDGLVEFIKNPREPMPKVFATPTSPEDDRTIRDIATFIMQWQ
jgi:alcohol dehydrogenase (cytochrome c)